VTTQPTRTKGTRTFLVVWFGQFVSLIGTSLTGFALAIVVFQNSGSATQLALVLLASQLPQILFTPLAGTLVDRWDRRWAMILADGGAGMATLGIVALVLTDNLELIYLMPLLAVQGLFQTFQWPAYTAATTLLVPKEQYGRAAGLVQLAEAVGQVIAPALAGILLVWGGLEAVLALDVITFLFAVGTLLVVRFPRPARTEAGAQDSGSIWSETRQGWRYLRARHGLLALLLYFATLNLIFGFIGVIVFPLVLGFTDEQAMGFVFSIAAIGMVIGSILMSAWGGPKRKIYGLYGAVLVLAAGLALMGLRPSVAMVTVAGFIGFASIPIGNGSSQAIWQAKVEPDIQGRVFALRRTISQAATPLALILAGPLVDGVFEPLMAPDGALAGSVGAVIGTGAGRGAALMFVVLGVLAIGSTIVAYSYGPLRNLERDIPDALPDDDGAASQVLPVGSPALNLASEDG
jgi:MFS family permease